MENANSATWTLVRLVWGQGHNEVKVILRSNCKCLTFYRQVGGGPSSERRSCSGGFHKWHTQFSSSSNVIPRHTFGFPYIHCRWGI